MIWPWMIFLGFAIGLAFGIPLGEYFQSNPKWRKFEKDLFYAFNPHYHAIDAIDAWIKSDFKWPVIAPDDNNLPSKQRHLKAVK